MKVELFNDNFQNYKRYGINSKAQLVIEEQVTLFDVDLRGVKSE